LAVKNISYDMQYAALFVSGLYRWSEQLYEVREIKAFWGLFFFPNCRYRTLFYFFSDSW